MNDERGVSNLNDMLSMIIGIAFFMVFKYSFTNQNKPPKITHLAIEYVITVGFVLVIKVIIYGFSSLF